MPIDDELRTLLYGGWNSHREWAENDFRPKAQKPLPESAEIAEPSGPDLAPEFSAAAPRPHRAPVAAPAPPPRPPQTPPPGQAEEEFPQPRPYVLTDGRTRSVLQVHALVSTTPRGLAELRELLPEQRGLCLACREPHSVAEVAALLRLPLGVARVLVDDLVRRGLVEVRIPDPRPGDGTLLRLIDGLREL